MVVGGHIAPLGAVQDGAIIPVVVGESANLKNTLCDEICEVALATAGNLTELCRSEIATFQRFACARTDIKKGRGFSTIAGSLRLYYYDGAFNSSSKFQQLGVLGDVLHGVAVVDVAQSAGFVDEHLGWHTAELEQVDLLAIQLEHCYASGSGKPTKGISFSTQYFSEGFCFFGADGDDFGIFRGELVIVLAQLRHVRLAEWSQEGAVEDQNDVLVFPTKSERDTG